MVQLTIRCHPIAPVAPQELEHWLERQVEELRREVGQGTVRLSRLRQELPTAALDIGWLLELELPEDGPLLARHRLAETVADMRLLGLEPTLLTRIEPTDWSPSKGNGVVDFSASAEPARRSES